LAANPRLILADEPTAALDKASGREVVDLMSCLAREQNIPILIVTHDNRILDVADRILSLEEGRLSSFSQAFMTSGRNTLAALMRYGQKADLLSQVIPLPAHDFTAVMQRLADQMENVQDVLDLLASGSLSPFLGMLLEVLGSKISQLVGAERGTVFLVDQHSGELWSLAVSVTADKPVEIRLPPGTGIAGRVAASGIPMNVPDTCSEPAFHAEVDHQTGFRTRNLLCVPLLGRGNQVIAVVQLLNKKGAPHFNCKDQQHFQNLATLLAGPIETWARLSDDSPKTALLQQQPTP
jgi:putative ABC transport system ATP-binding protein